MSISGIGSGSANLVSLYQQRHQDLSKLESAVQSGDITNAQQMLAAYQQDGQSIQTAQASTDGRQGGYPQSAPLSGELVITIGSLQAGGATGAQAASGILQQQSQSAAAGNAAPSQSSFMQALSALIQAVQSGDAAGAQKAATALQSDAATQATGGHHHHHHGGLQRAASDADAATSSASATSSGATAQSSSPLTYGVDESDAEMLAIL